MISWHILTWGSAVCLRRKSWSPSQTLARRKTNPPISRHSIHRVHCASRHRYRDDSWLHCWSSVSTGYPPIISPKTTKRYSFPTDTLSQSRGTPTQRYTGEWDTTHHHGWAYTQWSSMTHIWCIFFWWEWSSATSHGICSFGISFSTRCRRQKNSKQYFCFGQPWCLRKRKQTPLQFTARSACFWITTKKIDYFASSSSRPRDFLRSSIFPASSLAFWRFLSSSI